MFNDRANVSFLFLLIIPLAVLFDYLQFCWFKSLIFKLKSVKPFLRDYVLYNSLIVDFVLIDN